MAQRPAPAPPSAPAGPAAQPCRAPPESAAAGPAPVPDRRHGPRAPRTRCAPPRRGPRLRGPLQRVLQRRHRPGSDLLVGRTQVDQIAGVDENREVSAGAQQRILLRVPRRMCPASRIGDEDLDDFGADRVSVGQPTLGQATGDRNVRSEREKGARAMDDQRSAAPSLGLQHLPSVPARLFPPRCPGPGPRDTASDPRAHHGGEALRCLREPFTVDTARSDCRL